MRSYSLLAAFILGACATTAVQTVAEDLSPAASVVAPIERVVHAAPHGKATITHLAEGKNAYLGRLTLLGGAKVPEHRDTTEEYLYILEGRGEVVIDDVTYPVGPGSAIYMPANAKVSYTNGPDELVTLQVFAGPVPAKKYEDWNPESALTKESR